MRAKVRVRYLPSPVTPNGCFQAPNARGLPAGAASREADLWIGANGRFAHVLGPGYGLSPRVMQISQR